MLKIVTVPNPVLNSPAKPVEKIDNKIKEIIFDMEETLIAQVDPQGVGLAAPQVGLPLRIFIIKPQLDAETEVFINPQILEIKNEASKPASVKTPAKRRKKEDKLEGCLSIPRIWGPVKRADKVYLEYQDIDGISKKEWFSGLKAVIIQHEMDHLKGILFTQRALEQSTPIYEEKDGELVNMGNLK